MIFILFWLYTCRLIENVQIVVTRVWPTPQGKPGQLMRDKLCSMAVLSASKHVHMILLFSCLLFAVLSCS